jgi:transposase
VLGELIPGGVPKVITTARAARVLRAIRPEGAVQAARCELAAAFLDDLRRIDARIRETRKKLAVTVAAAGTSLTGLFGVGPVIAAAVIGDVRDVSRFPRRDHFAAYNGTAPIEVSSVTMARAGRQAQALVRATDTPPGWSGRPITMEELVLGYLKQPQARVVSGLAAVR